MQKYDPFFYLAWMKERPIRYPYHFYSSFSASSSQFYTYSFFVPRISISVPPSSTHSPFLPPSSLKQKAPKMAKGIKANPWYVILMFILHVLFRNATSHWQPMYEKFVTCRFVAKEQGLPLQFMVHSREIRVYMQLKATPKITATTQLSTTVCCILSAIASTMAPKITHPAPTQPATLTPLRSHIHPLKCPPTTFPTPQNIRAMAMLLSLFQEPTGIGSKWDRELEMKPASRPVRIEFGSSRDTCLKYFRKLRMWLNSPWLFLYSASLPLLSSYILSTSPSPLPTNPSPSLSFPSPSHKSISGTQQTPIGKANTIIRDKSPKQVASFPNPRPIIVRSGAMTIREDSMTLARLKYFPFSCVATFLQQLVMQIPCSTQKSPEPSPPTTLAANSTPNLKPLGLPPSPCPCPASTIAITAGTAILTKYAPAHPNKSNLDFLRPRSTKQGATKYIKIEATLLAVRQDSPQPRCLYFWWMQIITVTKEDKDTVIKKQKRDRKIILRRGEERMGDDEGWVYYFIAILYWNDFQIILQKVDSNCYNVHQTVLISNCISNQYPLNFQNFLITIPLIQFNPYPIVCLVNKINQNGPPTLHLLIPQAPSLEPHLVPMCPQPSKSDNLYGSIYHMGAYGTIHANDDKISNGSGTRGFTINPNMKGSNEKVREQGRDERIREEMRLIDPYFEDRMYRRGDSQRKVEDPRDRNTKLRNYDYVQANYGQIDQPSRFQKQESKPLQKYPQRQQITPAYNPEPQNPSALLSRKLSQPRSQSLNPSTPISNPSSQKHSNSGYLQTHGSKLLTPPIRHTDQDTIFQRQQKPYNIINCYPKEIINTHRHFPKYTLENKMIETGIMYPYGIGAAGYNPEIGGGSDRGRG